MKKSKWQKMLEEQYSNDYLDEETLVSMPQERFLAIHNTLVEKVGIMDTRIQKKCVYSLYDILFIIFAAMLCQLTSFRDMEEFAQSQIEWLSRYIDTSHGVPAHDTYRYIMNMLEPGAFQDLCQAFTEQLSSKGDHIAIDGKSVIGYYPTSSNRVIHAVGAYGIEEGIVFRVQSTINEEGKEEGEYQAIPLLLDKIDIKEKVVSLDAGGCYDVIANKIQEKGGDYIIGLKENQPSIHKTAKEMFSSCSEKQSDHTTLDNGHGREEIRTYTTLDVPADFPKKKQWPHLRTITRVESSRTVHGTTSKNIRYYLSSLDSLHNEEIAKKIRSHWCIENQLHWTLDVTFREDSSRHRIGNSVENMLIARRFVLTMLNQTTKKKSPSQSLKKAIFNLSFRSQVMEVFFPKRE